MARLMGLDLGEKRIGIAVSDELGIVAQPYGVLTRKNRSEDDVRELKNIIERLSVDTLVIGLPRNMDGTYGRAAEAARRFADLLARETCARVVLFDERLTTSMATRALIEADVSRRKRRETVDKLAAQIMLQAYMDSTRNTAEAKPGT